jgi:hypothetical protein
MVMAVVVVVVVEGGGVELLLLMMTVVAANGVVGHRVGHRESSGGGTFPFLFLCCLFLSVNLL